MKHMNTLCGQDAMLLTFFVLMEMIPRCFKGLKEKIILSYPVRGLDRPLGLQEVE
jgi:hypothetical protein